MKRYQLRYHLALDRGHKYYDMENTPDFHNEREAIDFWNKFKEKLVEENFNNYPIVVIRREISTTEVKAL